MMQSAGLKVTCQHLFNIFRSICSQRHFIPGRRCKKEERANYEKLKEEKEQWRSMMTKEQAMDFIRASAGNLAGLSKELSEGC